MLTILIIVSAVAFALWWALFPHTVPTVYGRLFGPYSKQRMDRPKVIRIAGVVFLIFMIWMLWIRKP